jgi:hypothetical protein
MPVSMRTTLALAHDTRGLHIAALLVAVAYLAIATWTLGAYGPTWDCTLGDYAYGEATWQALQTGEDPVALYEEGSAATRQESHPAFENRFRWGQLFPFAATLSAASCDVFWSWLGWLTPIAAHHLVISLFVAALLYGVVVFFGRRSGLLPAVVAAAFLIASPRFFAHAQNNLKDMPEACLYSLCAFAFFKASSCKNLRWWCGVGVLSALALAQKQNALFLPVQFGITAVLFWALIPSERAWRERAFWRGVGFGLAVFVSTYALASPWLWHDWTRVADHFREFSVSGLTEGPTSGRIS